MLLLYYITQLSFSFYVNLTIHSIKYSMSQNLISESPILIFPKIKSTLLSIYLSKFFISKSNTHLLYSTNHFNYIILDKLQINSFLTQPIYINQHEFSKCPDFERGEYNMRSIFIKDCYFNDCYTEGFDINSANGGALYISYANEITLSNVIFERCGCTICGGAVYILDSNFVLMENCTYSKCLASYKLDFQSYRCYGAAFGLHNIYNVNITKCNFLDNYIHYNSTNIYSDIQKYTIAFINCPKTIVNGLFFNNNKNVIMDVYFSIEYNFIIKEKAELTVIACCFLTNTDNAIEFYRYQNDKNILLKVNAIQNSFIQNEPFTFLSIDDHLIMSYDINNNFVNQPYCKYTHDFTQSIYFTSSSKFSSSSRFTSSSIFASNEKLKTNLKFTTSLLYTNMLILTKSSYFSDSTIFVFNRGGVISEKSSNIIYISVGIVVGVIVIVAIIIVVVLLLKKSIKKDESVKELYINDEENLQFSDDLNYGL